MDIAALTAPLPGIAGCGPDLGLTPAHDAIRRLREEEDAGLPQGEWRREPRTADWPGVLQACDELLRGATKDLRLAAWWAEAAAQLRGPAGLADGLELAATLVERWGDALHPRLAEAETDARAAALRWCLSMVERRAGAAPVLRIGRRPFGTDAIAAARRRGDDEAAAAPEDGPPGIAAIRRAAAAAGADAFAAHDAAWQRADAALSRLRMLGEAPLGDDAPSFAPARDAIARAATATRLLAREAGVETPQEPRPEQVAAAPVADGRCGDAARGNGHEPPTPRSHDGSLTIGSCADAPPRHPASARHGTSDPAPEAADDDPPATPGARVEPASPSTRLHPIAAMPGARAEPGLHADGRNRALSQLRAAAAWFHATEPHSPVAYLVDKAVRWADLPLHHWLREVLPDDAARARIEELLGSAGRDSG